ncbi:chain-length determining protein [Methylobacillus flagellatus]|uniref:chain-length determining protein n=1 Tax=Methylobacillus flagellatus TaxID=405 RepID=UPI0010F9F554|nr:chain-length determining protein [Methylobacillus flagellatus]
MKKILKKPSIWLAILAAIASTSYWGVIASSRYVSESHVMMQSTNITGQQQNQVDLSGILGGGGAASGIAKPDQLLLKDYLTSVDLMQKLNNELNLRKHYTQPDIDIISRMWSEDLSNEWFYRYFLRRIEVTFDDISGILIIKTQGFSPEVAQAINSFMLLEGERYMNSVAQKIALDQVSFLQGQTDRAAKRNLEARQSLISYQNAKGLASPETTAENINAIISGLESTLAELRAKRKVMSSYINPNSPSIVEVDFNIKALESQIEQEQRRLTSKSGKTLNKSVEEFQRLQLAAEFSQEMYKNTLATLERGKLQAASQLKRLTVIQTPTLPQYPLEPRRIFNSFVYIVFILLITGIFHLIAAIIRDHKD